MGGFQNAKKKEKRRGGVRFIRGSLLSDGGTIFPLFPSLAASVLPQRKLGKEVETERKNDHNLI